jgi:GNAT superfamily N-acetyltransferase
VAFTIEELGSQHRRKEFACGEPSLDEYIRRYASQDVKRNVARIFVATEPGDPGQILGYYAISAGSVQAAQLPAEYSKRVPKYPVPVALIGRLAVSEAAQGKGLGSVLLADALQRIVKASESLAVHAVVVDALHARARAFYEQFGFVPLPEQPLRLFLPLETIGKALS